MDADAALAEAAALAERGETRASEELLRRLERDGPWDDGPDPVAVRRLQARLTVALAGHDAQAGRLTASAARYDDAITALGGLRADVPPPLRERITSGLVQVAFEAAKVARALGRDDRARALHELGDALASDDDADDEARDAALVAALALPDAAASAATWASVEQRVRDSLGLVATPSARATLRGALARVCALTGRLEEADRLLVLTGQDARASGTPSQNWWWLDLDRAAVALDRGDLARARSVLDARDDDLVPDSERPRLLAVRSRVASALGDHDTAVRLAEEAASGPGGGSVGVHEQAQLAHLARGDWPAAAASAAAVRALAGDLSPDDLAMVELTQLRLDRAVLEHVEAGRIRVPRRDLQQLREEHRYRAVVTALAFEALRFQLGTGHARRHWDDLGEEAYAYAVDAAVAAGDATQVLHLVDHRAASGRPVTATTTYGPGAIAAPVDAGLLLSLPPRIGYPNGYPGLVHELAAAEQHFGIAVRDEHVVLHAPASSPRPTAHLRLADAGDTFASWTWTGCDQPAGVTRYVAADRDEAMARLRAALPDPLDGESPEDAVRRALAGPLRDPERELDLMLHLARTFLPGQLAHSLAALVEAGHRPLLRVQPSPRTAALPWALLADTDGSRVIDHLDVEHAAPLGLRPPSVVGRRWRPGSARVLVLDPRVPGHRADSDLGSVLGRPDPGSALAVAVAADLQRNGVADVVSAFRSETATRTWLGERLREDPGTLFYVGHVTTPGLAHGQSEDAALHLADTAGEPGLAPAVRTHRPLSVLDLLVGTTTSDAAGVPGPVLWPAPPRVVLLACRSGAEAGCADAFGPAAAMVHNGAEHVVGTAWTLPTDRLLGTVGPVGTVGERPFDRLAADLMRLTDADDPTAALGALLRGRLDRWRSGEPGADGPLLWGALTCLTP